MGMFVKDGTEYLTISDLMHELNLPKSTVYNRFSFASAPERWKVEVVKDPKDKREKYVVTRENFEAIWRPYQNKSKQAEKDRKRFIKSKTTKK